MRKRCKTGIPGSDVNTAARLQAVQSCARRRLEDESSQIYIRGGFSLLCVSNLTNKNSPLSFWTQGTARRVVTLPCVLAAADRPPCRTKTAACATPLPAPAQSPRPPPDDPSGGTSPDLKAGHDTSLKETNHFVSR